MVLIATLLLSISFAQVVYPQGLRSPFPSGRELTNKSDLIVVAKTNSFTRDGVSLSVDRALKGTFGFRELTAGFPMPGMGAPNGTGVWFLKASGSEFEVMPLESTVSLPIAAGTPDPPSGTLGQQLVWYVAEWYLSLPHPTRSDDFTFLARIHLGDKSEAMAAAERLVNSGSREHVAAGVIAEIETVPDEGLNALADHIDEIEASPSYSRIPMGIVTGDRSHSEKELPALRTIASKHVATPNLDAAVAGRLVQIGGPHVLPVMAILRDSHDPQISKGATDYLAHFPDGSPNSTVSIDFWRRQEGIH